MKYTFETLYNQEALTIMAKCLRKTVRRKKSKRSHFLGTEIATAFISETAIGKSEFSYDKVAQIAETERYFVFIFSENHAQVYDKVSISGGTVDEFREFISKVTNKTVVFVS